MISTEIAHEMALVPLAWLLLLQARGRAVDPGLWWMAGALGVSWIPDQIAHYSTSWLPTNVYPITQAAIIVRAITDRTTTARFLVALAVAAIISAIFPPAPHRPELIVTTTAFLGVVWFVWPLWGLGNLRTALLVYFALGALAWIAFFVWQQVPAWYVYQSTRLTGLLLFCWAASTPHLKLRA